MHVNFGESLLNVDSDSGLAYSLGFLISNKIPVWADATSPRIKSPVSLLYRPLTTGLMRISGLWVLEALKQKLICQAYNRKDICAAWESGLDVPFQI